MLTLPFPLPTLPPSLSLLPQIHYVQTVNIARESKEKVEQAMLERDQALAREAQGRREIARLLEQRRAQASEAMEHEEASLESSKKRLLEQLAARDKNFNELASLPLSETAPLNFLGALVDLHNLGSS